MKLGDFPNLDFLNWSDVEIVDKQHFDSSVRRTVEAVGFSVYLMALLREASDRANRIDSLI